MHAIKQEQAGQRLKCRCFDDMTPGVKWQAVFLNAETRSHQRASIMMERTGHAADSAPNVGAQSEQVAEKTAPRVIDILREYTPLVASCHWLAFNVLSALAKILLCRTATLKGRSYECPQCDYQTSLYNYQPAALMVLHTSFPSHSP